jgi:hypothetical protein
VAPTGPARSPHATYRARATKTDRKKQPLGRLPSTPASAGGPLKRTDGHQVPRPRAKFTISMAGDVKRIVTPARGTPSQRSSTCTMAVPRSRGIVANSVILPGRAA